MNRRKWFVALTAMLCGAALKIKVGTKPRGRTIMVGGTYYINEPIHLYGGDVLVDCKLIMGNGGCVVCHDDAGHYPRVDGNRITFTDSALRANRIRYGITLQGNESSVLYQLG